MAMLQRLASTAKNAVSALFGGRGPAEPDEPRFEDDLITFANEEFERRRKERLGEELQWRLNMAFAAGDQYYSINTVKQTLDELPVQYEWEQREVYDQLSPILEVRHARLTRGKLVRKVRPGSGQQKDISSAEKSSNVIRYTEQETEDQENVSELVAWLELLGTAFKKNGWNPDAGRLVAQVQDEQGNPTEIHEGDLETMVVPAMEVYPDNLFASWKANRSIIHARAYHVRDIEDRWGVRVEPEDVDTQTLQPSANGRRSMGYVHGTFSTKTQKLAKHALVKEYWERVSKRYPRGRLIIVARDKLLYAGPLPFNVDKDSKPGLPFAPYYDIQRPGMFFGTCLLPRLIPLQRRWNGIRNQEAEYEARAAIGQLKVYENTLDNEEEIELNGAAPGQIFKLKASAIGKEPSYMDFPPLSPQFQTDKDTILRELQSASGVSDLSKLSSAPAGVKSGVALSIALEQDETRLASTAGNIERAMVEEAKHWLRLYKQFAQLPRLARITNGSEVELVDWSAADITSDDVIIEGGTGLGESPAQRKQHVYDLLSSGILNDPDTGALSRDGRARLLEALEYGHWESAADSDYDLQRSKAQRQVQVIKTGQLPSVAPFDDPVTHLAILHRWMLSSEFEEMAQDQRVMVTAYQYREELMFMLQQQAAQKAAEQQAQMVQGPMQPPQQMPQMPQQPVA